MATPKLSIANPQLNVIKENKMATGIKQFVGQKLTRKVKFMGGEIEITKLSIEAVQEIQEKAKAVKENETEGFSMLRKVIELSVADCADLSDQEFSSLPIDELTRLSGEIMKFSGLDTEKSGK